MHAGIEADLACKSAEQATHVHGTSSFRVSILCTMAVGRAMLACTKCAVYLVNFVLYFQPRLAKPAIGWLDASMASYDHCDIDRIERISLPLDHSST